jgi:hypothetical protein
MHKHRYQIYFFTLFAIVVRTNDCLLPPINVILINDSPLCEANESYMDCGNLCEMNSRNYGHPPTYDPVYNRKKCIPGCYCMVGYLRSSKGHCVLDSLHLHKGNLIDLLFQKLNFDRISIAGNRTCNDPNEIYRRCGQYCEQYCKGPHCIYPKKAFTPSGCYCRKNYERDEVTRVCIRRNCRRCILQSKCKKY